MLRDFLDGIKDLAEKAAQKKADPVLKPLAEPDFLYFLPGDTEPRRAKPTPRAHEAGDLTAILAFALANKTSSVFFNREGVICLLDDGDRRDAIRLQLDYSPQLKKLMQWETAGAVKVEQRPLIITLRTLFRRCMEACPMLVDAIRKVKFEAGASAAGTVGKNKASMTTEMIAQVTGDVELPEEFNLVVPVFDGVFPLLKATVTIALDADGAEQKFTLTPIPGDIETGIGNAEAEIGAAIATGLQDAKEQAARVYFGKA